MKRLLIAVAALAILAGCVRNPEVYTPEQLNYQAYRQPGPSTLTLYTVINANTGAGAHTALAVNGSERVLFDPAGSFKATDVIRSGDVIYGFTPAIEDAFMGKHARTRYIVEKHEFAVSPAVAEEALQKVKANGPVGAAFCAQSTSSILTTLPGFKAISPTFYPKQLKAQVVELTGARAEVRREND
jgi:hypothetical protein